MQGPLWMGSPLPCSITRLDPCWPWQERRGLEKQSQVWPWHELFQHRCHPSLSCHRVPPVQLQGWLWTSVYSSGPGRAPSIWHHPCHSGQQCPAHSWLLICTSERGRIFKPSPSVVYKLNAIPPQIPLGFYTELHRPTPEFIWRGKWVRTIGTFWIEKLCSWWGGDLLYYIQTTV